MKTLALATVDRSRRGGALVISLLVAAALAAVAAAAFTLSVSQNAEVSSQAQELRALNVAEAGLTESIRRVAVAVSNLDPVPAAVDSEADGVAAKTGSWSSTIVDNGDGTYTITSTGLVGGARRDVQAVVREIENGVFDHAIFAGNSSGDPAYDLRLSGSGGQADNIIGDVYSGNDLTVADDATVSGDASATGVITGMAGEEGARRPIPDIAGMNYEVNHDYDVAAMFAASATPGSSPLGGTAMQLPASNPAHIFRLNPNDRLAEINGTAKDDYFLEDPTMPVFDFTAWNGNRGHTVRLSGTMGTAGVNSTNKVFYIDGNLWVHNKPWGRMMLSAAGGARVTFVVKGNIYFSDDVLLGDPDHDGLAFIAIEDDQEPDSGNIYLGDPRYGTIERMYAFLYAQNNFYDNNLDAAGSKIVELFGNMTAGNHVSIQRDYTKADGTVEHSKLTVDFDDRISTGALELPGLPRSGDSGLGSVELVLWREVADQ